MEIRRSHWITGLVTALITAVVTPLVSYLYGNIRAVNIRNTVFALFFALLLCFVYMYLIKAGKMDYDNGDHPYRFLFTYLVAFALSMILPLIDQTGWPFMCFCVAISLFTNSLLGIYSATGLLAFTVMISDRGDISAFLVYFLACFIACLLFQDIENNFKVGGSIAISAILMFVFETAGFVIFVNRELSAEEFIIPLVNVLVNVLVLFLCLKYFNEKVANRYRNKYLELNDQGYSVLLELKERSAEEYYRSIHTAYLVERIANSIGCDVDVAKNCAYYHRIKKAFGYSPEDCRDFVEKHQFPPKAAMVLLDFLSKDPKVDSKEAGIVYLADKFISSIQMIFKKDSKAKVDYGELLETIISKDYIRKNLVNSDLSIKDCRLLKEVILKETLYYDFLR